MTTPIRKVSLWEHPDSEIVEITNGGWDDGTLRIPIRDYDRSELPLRPIGWVVVITLEDGTHLDGEIIDMTRQMGRVEFEIPQGPVIFP